MPKRPAVADAAPGKAVPVLAHLSGFADAILPALVASVPEAEFIEVTPSGPPPAESEVLVTLLSDRPQLEPLLAGVRWIHVLGAGVDGFPMGLVGDRTITCSRGASAAAISEFVLASMLAFVKRFPATWLDRPPVRWNVANLGGLRGQTLGLVGLGAIGTEVARRSLAFEMRVLAARRDPSKRGLDGVEITSLDRVLSEADHLVITAASTESTRHLLGSAAFGQVKPGVHLVNIARGALIDQDALLDALDSERVALASLDVADPEPLPAGHALYGHPRVHLSAHVSWSSPDTGRRTVEIFADNFSRWRAGRPLNGIVDAAQGY